MIFIFVLFRSNHRSLVNTKTSYFISETHSVSFPSISFASSRILLIVNSPADAMLSNRSQSCFIKATSLSLYWLALSFSRSLTLLVSSLIFSVSSAACASLIRLVSRASFNSRALSASSFRRISIVGRSNSYLSSARSFTFMVWLGKRIMRLK